MGMCTLSSLQIAVLLRWILLVGHIQEFQCFHLMMRVSFLVAQGAEVGSSRAPHSDGAN